MCSTPHPHTQRLDGKTGQFYWKYRLRFYFPDWNCCCKLPERLVLSTKFQQRGNCTSTYLHVIRSKINNFLSFILFLILCVCIRSCSFAFEVLYTELPINLCRFMCKVLIYFPVLLLICVLLRTSSNAIYEAMIGLYYCDFIQ